MQKPEIERGSGRFPISITAACEMPNRQILPAALDKTPYRPRSTATNRNRQNSFQQFRPIGLLLHFNYQDVYGIRREIA